MIVRRALPWLVVCAAALFLIGSTSAALPNGPSTGLVISEVYGAGGNAGSDYPVDYVELFNRGTTSVSLDGKSLQYTSATGTGNFGSFSGSTTVLSGSVEAGRYVLVQASGSAPVAGDVTLLANMAGGAGKVALAEGTAPLACNSAASCALNGADSRIIDLVGYGNANYFEGAGPAQGASTTMSTKRNEEGCVESDNNAGDFAASDQDPDTRSSAPNACSGPPADRAPSVAATVPVNGQTEVPESSNVTITFSEPVTAAPGAFAIVCGATTVTFTVTSDPTGTTYVLDPTSDLSTGVTCTISVEGDLVRDVDTSDPPDQGADHNATFTTRGFRVRIHDIQDSSHLSPYDGRPVSQVPGIVTSRRFNGFTMQDPRPDSLVETSEGIFVFTGSAPPALAAIGSPVAVTGTVSEFRAGCSPCVPTAGGYANLTITQIGSPLVLPGTELGTIAPTVVGQGGRVPPATIIEDDAAGDVETSNAEFDVAEDGVDFYESLEGMLVRVNEPVAVGPLRIFNAGRVNENREVPVLADNGAGASVRTPRGGIIVRSLDPDTTQDYREGDFNPERIILSDAGAPRFPPLDVSDRFTPHADAIVDYSFANYKFIVLNDPTRVDGGLEREVADEPQPNELAVATLNVENLDALDPQSRFDEFAREIDVNLRLPDLLGVEEMQDNDGPLVGPSNAELTWSRLIAAIEARNGIRYDYRQIDPVPCTDQTPETSDENPDGGEPCGNIRVGFLFRTDRGLEFVDRPGGTAVTPNDVVGTGGGPQLLYSPGRIDPNNPAFASSRKPLAGEFQWRGRTFFAVANHFNSKGGDDPLFGRFQPPQRRSEVQRHQQATIVRDFVRKIFALDDKANVIVLGDLNDFWFSETLEILESAPLVNLARLLPLSERYSYVFDGNSQSLDHILVSEHLARGADKRRFDYVHVNSEFFDQVSDHDPPLARLLLGGVGRP